MSDLFDNPGAVDELPRDRYKRPLVIPPGGMKAVAYTRTTTFVDVLEDKYQLQQWELRMAALGLADRPDLLLSVAAHRDDKAQLNNIVSQAKEAAKSSAKSTTGTALHKLCERLDRGEQLGVVPAAYQADIQAYQAKTHGMEWDAIEQFTVYDPYKIGGTPDRVISWRGHHYIGDIKTGSIEWGGLKIAMQLAAYSRATPYDYRTGKRTPYEFDVDQNQAVVIHLPAGEGMAFLHWVDIDAGWHAVQTARDVRTWRSRRDWFTPIEDQPATVDVGGLSDDALVFLVESAETFDELRKVWVEAVKDGIWTDKHTRLAALRRAALEKAS